jgi:hypothetical protein
LNFKFVGANTSLLVTTPTKAQVCWREYKFVGARFVGDNTNKGAKAQHQQRRKKFVGERFVGDNTNKGANIN